MTGVLRYASFDAQISEEPATGLDRFLDLSEGALERWFVEGRSSEEPSHVRGSPTG